jgi:hypothetical protein
LCEVVDCFLDYMREKKLPRTENLITLLYSTRLMIG